MKILLYILIIFYNPVPLFADQDCDVLDYETGSFSIGFKAGGFGYGVGPEVSWSSSYGTKWNDALQYMVAEYQELCSRYNTGRISDAEYKKEIDLIIKRSRGYTLELNRLFRIKKQSIFNEMEKEVSR
jgi:hypothetical protein